jgi:glycosyltransferase involved in cell wall biosynthesis
MISVLIPVKDGGAVLRRCLAGIADQDVADEVEVVVVDSGSRDGSVELARTFGARVYEISPSEFGHGRTRNLAANLARGDTLVFTSQDAVAADGGWVRRLVAPLADSGVAGVYGRQLPHEDATPPERFFLDFLYGPRRREQRIGDIAELTYERTLFSNVNSAMRRATWADHPFRDDLIMSEDQEWSRRMLLAGFSIVYEPEAVVRHSHRYSVTAAFRRFFDSGISAKRSYVAGSASRTALRGAALRYAGGELSWLWRSGRRHWIPYAGVYELSKFAGLQLGLRHEWLPVSLKRRLSAQLAHWTRQRVAGGRLRVLLVSANFRPSVGGIERFVEILAEGLAERGHAVTVATCTPGQPSQDGGSVRVVRIPATDVMRERLNVPYPVPPPRACVRTLSELLQEADVVHVQDAIYATSVVSLLLARHVGVASVLTQHVGFVPQRRLLLDAGQHAAIRTLGHAARLADAVATYNPSVAEWARQTWGLDDVRVLPSGVLETTTSPAERAAVRAELGLPAGAFVGLFTGRDVPKKRLDVFLASGDPAYDLVAVTDRRGAAPNGARLVPFTTPERFGRLLAAADAFVLPSEGEGFPLALQEALLAGIPCVVTPGPGYELYLDESDVVFVPPEPEAIRKALVRLASDAAFREGLAERARAAGARSFGAGPFVAAYERLYRIAVSNSWAQAEAGLEALQPPR